MLKLTVNCPKRCKYFALAWINGTGVSLRDVEVIISVLIFDIDRLCMRCKVLSIHLLLLTPQLTAPVARFPNKNLCPMTRSATETVSR
jgi:hypothetical protein